MPKKKIFLIISIIIIGIIIILLNQVFYILQVTGNSMEPNLEVGNLLISSKIFKIKKGDIVAINYQDMILIRRIIATQGDIVDIKENGEIYVNSSKLDEPYVENLSYGNCNITFPYQVREGEVFVLGDNREESIDSRNSQIGSIDEEKIIGVIY